MAINYINGGYVATWDGNGVYDTSVQYYVLTMTIATAAIALGLNKKEAVEFGTLAYGRCRGKTPADAYEELITLAYEIKGRNG